VGEPRLGHTARRKRGIRNIVEKKGRRSWHWKGQIISVLMSTGGRREKGGVGGLEEALGKTGNARDGKGRVPFMNTSSNLDRTPLGGKKR